MPRPVISGLSIYLDVERFRPELSRNPDEVAKELQRSSELRVAIVDVLERFGLRVSDGPTVEVAYDLE